MSSSADQQKQQRRRRRAREVENASQTQVHHFDEQDDDQDQEDDDEEEEEEGRDDERHRHQTSRMNPDPYNVQLMSSSQPHHDYPVYDSMSTILEVDSEGASQVSDQDTKSTSSERPRDLGSPLEVQTTPTRRQQRSSGSPVGGLSPGDKFGGTLSALAAQMERLQKKASSGQATGRSQDFTSSSSSTGTTPEGDQRRSPTKTGHDQDRATSAESLMMINISPVGSPRVKFPLTRQATSKSDSPIVEVSNKSTNTLIDMKLMQQMAEKYFIEQSDKSTQSIKFDCDENEFKTIDMINQRTGGSYQAKPQTKSIAVGTEKFSRERFSLLPATKTRSTQTKANMSDSDIGTSETRRFKLSHLSNLGPIIKANQTRRTGETTSEKRASPDRKPAELSVVRATGSESDDSLALEINKKGKDAEETRRINQKVEPAQKQPTKKEDSVSSSSDTTNYTSDDSLSTQSKGTTKSDEPTTTKEISAPPAKSDSKPATAIKTRGPSRDPKTQITLSEEKQVEDPQQQQQGQQIPSLKTELRVIIEFADSRNKQRNEMLSNSNLINGILNKRTEVSTSKHVAVSPRQVLERLQSAGQRHSLMYLPHQVAPQVTEHHGHHPQELPPAVTLPAQPQGGWQEVSRSTVCNEIESDTTRRTRHSTSNGNPNDQLIMSSDATIRQLPEDKSAIHLRSRATRRQQQPDPSSQRDKLLVESVAAFDESQLAEEVTPPSKGQVSAEKTSIIANQQVAASPAPPAKPEPLKPVNLGRQPNQPSHEQPRFVSSPFSRSPNQFVRQQTNRPQPIVMRRDEPLESPPPLQRPQQSPLRPTGHHREPPQVTSTARVEFEEEKEDRRQIRQNGRLIYDDRLREHHFESRRQPQTPSSPVQQPSQAPSGGIMRHSPRIAASSPNLNVTPSDRWHQRHSMQQQAVTTPASSTRLANTQPPPMFADQTSNLSSDQETLDSGFVQSGAGSSSNLINQQQQIHRRHQLTSMGNLRLSPHLQSAPTSPILVSKPAKSVQRQPKLSKHNDEDDDNSLTFVDDDDDDFVDQLGGSSRRLNRPRGKFACAQIVESYNRHLMLEQQ